MRKSNSHNSVGAGVTPRLPHGGSTVSGLARPGKRAALKAAASPVSSANGKVARPGFHQKTVKPAGRSKNVARPGGNQTLSAGVNSK